MDESKSADLAEMDTAAAEAKKELERNVGDWRAIDVVMWWKTWYMKAGHKRLGRVMVDIAKRSK